jgi:hypothetical protein
MPKSRSQVVKTSTAICRTRTGRPLERSTDWGGEEESGQAHPKSEERWVLHGHGLVVFVDGREKVGSEAQGASHGL